MMKFKEDVLSDFGINLCEKQLEQFKEYFNFLIKYNEITNLTNITQESEVYYKHFYDSLTLTRNIDLKVIKSLCDIGAGAGFPSIPIKIIFPHLKITIIDSLGKRINFLKELVKRLDLEEVSLYHARAEIFAQSNQNRFDLVTARAVASLRIICELALPMTKVGGHFIALKGANYQVELAEAKNTIKFLRATIVELNEFDLPYNYGMRTNIKILKDKHISGFPRSYAQILNKVL